MNETSPFGWPEYGRLRRVLMHAPGEEIDGIGPSTFRRHLFEDAIEPAVFRAQHRALVDRLRGEGVEVVLVEDVLHGTPLMDRLRGCPNLVYMRDTAAVSPAGFIEMRMASPVRRREPGIAAAALERLGIPRIAQLRSPATMEGGDLLFLDEDTLVVGVGNRTSASALRQLRERTRTHGDAVDIGIALPQWTIHLDGTMMLLDDDLALVHRESLRGRAAVYEAGRPPRRADPLPILRRRGFRLVEVTAYDRQRRATNVITLGPRRIIAYAGHPRVAKRLRDEGVDVLEVEGSELVRGGGGPRCLTAPIER